LNIQNCVLTTHELTIHSYVCDVSSVMMVYIDLRYLPMASMV